MFDWLVLYYVNAKIAVACATAWSAITTPEESLTMPPTVPVDVDCAVKGKTWGVYFCLLAPELGAWIHSTV
jgi:hypothetical protein